MTGHLGWVLAGMFMSGALLGATAMFYLTKLKIISRNFNPVPYLLAWMFIAGCWILGRLIRINRA